MTSIRIPTWALDKLTLVRIIRTITLTEKELIAENTGDKDDHVMNEITKKCLADCLAELACYPKPKLMSRVPKGAALKTYIRDGKLITPRRRF